jgi:hypothetical protein
MQQKGTVNITIEKGFEIYQVQNWINEKIKDGEVTEMKIYNTELIFDGSLNTFLGDIDVLSPAGVSKDKLNKLFRSHPYWIQQFVLNNFKPERGGIFMAEKSTLDASSKHPHIIDETKLNQLMANFSKKNADQIAEKSRDSISSDYTCLFIKQDLCYSN